MNQIDNENKKKTRKNCKNVFANDEGWMTNDEWWIRSLLHDNYDNAGFTFESATCLRKMLQYPR